MSPQGRLWFVVRAIGLRFTRLTSSWLSFGSVVAYGVVGLVMSSIVGIGYVATTGFAAFMIVAFDGALCAWMVHVICAGQRVAEERTSEEVKQLSTSLRAESAAVRREVRALVEELSRASADGQASGINGEVIRLARRISDRITTTGL